MCLTYSNDLAKTSGLLILLLSILKENDYTRDSLRGKNFGEIF
jgi:hypothetical protein